MRIVIAEDAAVIRAGLVEILTDRQHEVVAAVGDANALREAVAAHHPDVAVVDVRMPPTHTDEGLRAAIAIRREQPGLGVLVFSQYIETRYLEELLAASSARGAAGVGYLLKDRVADVNEFVDALTKVGGRRHRPGHRGHQPTVSRESTGRHSRRPNHARTGCASANGRRTLQQRHRRHARHYRTSRREAHRKHLQQTGPAAIRNRPPPRPSRTPLPAIVKRNQTRRHSDELPAQRIARRRPVSSWQSTREHHPCVRNTTCGAICGSPYMRWGCERLALTGSG